MYGTMMGIGNIMAGVTNRGDIRGTKIESGYSNPLALAYEGYLRQQLLTPAKNNPVYGELMGLAKGETRKVSRDTERKILEAFPDGPRRSNAIKQLTMLGMGEQEAIANAAKGILLALNQKRTDQLFPYLQGKAGDIQAQNSLRLNRSVSGAAALQDGMNSATSLFGS